MKTLRAVAEYCRVFALSSHLLLLVKALCMLPRATHNYARILSRLAIHQIPLSGIELSMPSTGHIFSHLRFHTCPRDSSLGRISGRGKRPG